VPLVVFESLGRPALVVSAPDGGRVLDLCDEYGAPVSFSCRGATCGTCRVHVLEGGSLFEPAGKDEVELLRLMGNDPASHRLACQALLRPGTGRVRVRAVVAGFKLR